MGGVGLAVHEQRVRAARDPQLLGLDLAPRQERRACRRTAVRAMAVVRGDEFVRDLVADGLAGAASAEHAETLLASPARVRAPSLSVVRSPTTSARRPW